MSSNTCEKPPERSREKVKEFLLDLQNKICNGLEMLDGEGQFEEESWERAEGGGGKSQA